jgi:hypothetical protein
MIKSIAGMFVYLVAMGGGLLLVSALPLIFVAALPGRRTQGSRAAIVISSTMMAAFLAGGILSWYLIPFDWHMSFWTTLKASVDSRTYGHPVEHKAESVLIWVLFGSVMSAIIAGGVAGIVTYLRTRVQQD